MESRSLSDEERRMKKSVYERNRRANYTKEQNLKIAERQRQRRANLSEEARFKILERERKKYANLTEEQRAYRAEYGKHRFANLSVEEHTRKLERDRRRRANLSVEGRARLLEYHRKKYAELTIEQRQSIREKKSKRAIVLREERRLKKLEYNQSRFAELSKVLQTSESDNEPKKLAIFIKELNVVKIMYNQKEKANCVNNEEFNSIENKWNKLEWPEGQNPFENIIKLIIKNDGNIGIINNIDIDSVKKIMHMLEIFSRQDILHQNDVSTKRINCEIFINILIELLKKWDGWMINTSTEYLSTTKASIDLYCYLSNQFEDIRVHKDKSLLDELNLYKTPINCVFVSCSLKQLKTMFYRRPNNFVKYYHISTYFSNFSYRPTALLPHYVNNLPYISTNITLPNFSMTHRNFHADEYRLVNVRNKIKIDAISQEINLSKIKKRRSKSETFLSNFITKFLHQLRIAVNKMDDSDIMKKSELITAIIEFEKDIFLCYDIIETNTNYYMPLSPYPYVRYLGYSDDDGLISPIIDQDLIDDSVLNIRLQQFHYPKISFNLEMFSVPYEERDEEIHFIFDASFLNSLNQCILYKCVLCNAALGSSMMRISDHFFMYHGLEPDWKCVKCFSSFSNECLIKNRWWHNCI